MYEQGHGVVTGTSEPGDHFGAVLTGGYSDAYAQIDTAYLLIGVPDEDIGRHVDAGRVVLIGESAGSALHQDSPGVPGTAESADRFGASVALDGYEGVLWFGAPGEDVGGFKDAGMILEAVVGADGQMRPSSTVHTQDTPGVQGSVEPGDRFGASLWWHTAGAPGEERRSSWTRPARCWPSSAAVTGYAQGHGAPGFAEPFDHFGATLVRASRSTTTGSGTTGIAMVVTVPGEDLGAVSNAGVLALQGWLSDSSGPEAQPFVGLQVLANPQAGAGKGMTVASTADRGWNAPTG